MMGERGGVLPEAHGDVRLLGPEQISDGEGGEAQKAPLRKRKRQRQRDVFILH